MSRRPTHLGHERTTPLTLGAPNGDPPRLVEATGLYLAIRKGEQRWATGAAVAAGLRQGVLIDVVTADPPALTSAQLDQAAAREPARGPTHATVPADTSLARLRPPRKAAAPKAKKAAGAPAKKRAPRKRVPKKA